MYAGPTGGRLEQNHPVLQPRAGASSQQSVHPQTQSCPHEERKTQTQLKTRLHLRDAGIRRTLDIRQPLYQLPLTDTSFWQGVKEKFFWCFSVICASKISNLQTLPCTLVCQSSVCLCVCLLFKASLGLHVRFCYVYILCCFNWCDQFFLGSSSKLKVFSFFLKDTCWKSWKSEIENYLKCVLEPGHR